MPRNRQPITISPSGGLDPETRSLMVLALAFTLDKWGFHQVRITPETPPHHSISLTFREADRQFLIGWLAHEKSTVTVASGSITDPDAPVLPGLLPKPKETY